VNEFKLCLGHDPSAKAGKHRATERAQHADNMETSGQAPAAYRNAHTATLSPNKFGQAGVFLAMKEI
jgi:hypothetical protein